MNILINILYFVYIGAFSASVLFLCAFCPGLLGMKATLPLYIGNTVFQHKKMVTV